MKNRCHGVFSLILFGAAAGMALVVLWMKSPAAGLIYAVLATLSVGVILYAYCAKCDIRDDACRHVIPGKITSMLPVRKPGRYTFFDYCGVVLPMVFILGFPQWWLRDHTNLWIIFWLLVVLGLVEILIFVCRGCGNRHCPMCTLRNGQVKIDRFPNRS